MDKSFRHACPGLPLTHVKVLTLLTDFSEFRIEDEAGCNIPEVQL